MIDLDEFRNLGLNITWTLIDIGLKGDKTFYNELTPKDILHYAASVLEQDVYPQAVGELAGTPENDIDEIDRYVKILASQEGIDRDKEFQKWVVCYVNHHIQKKHDNPIDGLMELGDIWLKLGMPNHCPHIFQGVNNNISPKEYYTLQNYENMLQRHTDWIKNELFNLQSESLGEPAETIRLPLP